MVCSLSAGRARSKSTASPFGAAGQKSSKRAANPFGTSESSISKPFTEPENLSPTMKPIPVDDTPWYKKITLSQVVSIYYSAALVLVSSTDFTALMRLKASDSSNVRQCLHDRLAYVSSGGANSASQISITSPDVFMLLPDIVYFSAGSDICIIAGCMHNGQHCWACQLILENPMLLPIMQISQIIVCCRSL